MRQPTPTVDNYIAARSPAVAALLKDLKGIVQKALPTARSEIKWGAPVFISAQGHPVIYLYGGKDHANIGFIQGIDLDDPNHMLEGKGKAGRHVKVFPGEAVPRSALKALIEQCADQ